jgi:chromosomal replication initiation ATPase DnaA
MKQNKLISPYVFPGIKHNQLPNDIRHKMNKFVMRAPEDITEDFIMGVVSGVSKIDAKDIASPNRSIRIVDARRIYIFNVKRYLKKSYVYIGKSLSNRDHTTITFSIKKYHDLYKNEEPFKRMADKVTQLIEFY